MCCVCATIKGHWIALSINIVFLGVVIYSTGNPTAQIRHNNLRSVERI